MARKDKCENIKQKRRDSVNNSKVTVDQSEGRTGAFRTHNCGPQMAVTMNRLAKITGDDDNNRETAGSTRL
jgi:hypothetical protein